MMTANAKEAVQETAVDDIPLAVLRAAIRDAVERSSLRAVAAQVEISPSGVHALLTNDSYPRSKTLNQLREWYIREAQMRPGMTQATANAAINLLLGRLPRQERSRVTSQLVEALHTAYGAANMHPPTWLSSVAAPR